MIIALLPKENMCAMIAFQDEYRAYKSCACLDDAHDTQT